MHGSVTIVYLSWLPYGIELYRRFLNSLISFPPGAEYKLLIVYNGVSQIAEWESFHHLSVELLGYEPAYILMKEGQDIDAYFTAWKKVDTELVIFFNSYTRFRRKGWLELYKDAFSNPDIGIVGATASFQSHYSSVFIMNKSGVEFGKGILHNFRKYKLFLKAFFYWKLLFPPFPNFHIRTNAFMVRVKALQSIRVNRIKSKLHAYQFESGYNSLTRQIQRSGYRAVVIDVQGRLYDFSNCSKSCTFWSGTQENLLVSDNQTDLYEQADASKKHFLTSTAWGNS